jgi:hypothetical protein
MRVPANTARIIIVVVAVAAIVIVIFVTGLADDKAPPGQRGQGTRDQHGHKRLPLSSRSNASASPRHTGNEAI